MGATLSPPEFSVKVTCTDRIKELLSIAKKTNKLTFIVTEGIVFILSIYYFIDKLSAKYRHITLYTCNNRTAHCM